MESIRTAPGFDRWMAQCKAMHAGPIPYGSASIPDYPPFEWEGKLHYYWPSIDDDGVIWPHGFSNEPMR